MAPDVAEAYDVVPTRTAISIDRASTLHGVDARLVRAVIQVESSYQSRARSPKGAMGLMQLMPETARRYAVKNPVHPAANVEAGTRYLKSLLDRFPSISRWLLTMRARPRWSGLAGFPPTRKPGPMSGRILKLVSARADIP